MTTHAIAQSGQAVIFNFASKAERLKTSAKLKHNIDSLIFIKADPIDHQHEWIGAFWAMELMLYKPASFGNMLPSFIKKLSKGSQEFQRSFLEMLYTLYPYEYTKSIKKIWRSLSNAKNQAMALEYLALTNIYPDIRYKDKIYKTGWYDSYIRRLLKTTKTKPSQNQFLDMDFLPDETIICSFQSIDRNIPGYAMIRKSDGSWLTDQYGYELKFGQLARSISNLPYYLTNGNTPQGLYKVTGTDISENKWIGPTRNIQMIMPFENDNSFFDDNKDFQPFYKDKLGKTLSQFEGLWESYEAGKLGRSEVIAHGTTIDPNFYMGQTYFPYTPSLGCLCCPEIWDDHGSIIKSAQQDLIDAIIQNHLKIRWLVVAETSDFIPVSFKY